MSRVATAAEGITNPPIDELLEKVENKYSLVIFASKRARQINAYYSQLAEGLLEYVGPLVETHVQEKPLSVALREVNDGLLELEYLPAEGEAASEKPTESTVDPTDAAAPVADDTTPTEA